MRAIVGLGLLWIAVGFAWAAILTVFGASWEVFYSLAVVLVAIGLFLVKGR